MTSHELAEMLASYVPKLIQKRVALHPSPIDSPVAEEIEAAVLFADISGFTQLTETLGEAGPAGAEQIASILNNYFGQIIDIIHHYGGDVVKFAGDAVIAVWTYASNEGTADPRARSDSWLWAMRASECAVEIRSRMSNYRVDGEPLYLKLAVSSGRINMAHVGGEFKRWEFLLTGTPLVEVGMANSLARSGEILLCPSAWKLIRGDCEAGPVEFEFKEAIAQGGRLESLRERQPIGESPQQAPLIPDEAEKSLRPYIPGAIINRLTAGQSSWIAELRRSTILFVNLPDVNQNTALADAQTIARLIQRSVYRYEGSINKINVDDKGITIVAAMGLPPFSHEDDPARGVQAALMIRDELNSLNVRSLIGVATGRIFCGSIGNDSRREYTTIGDAVNLSARLMTAAGQQKSLIEDFSIPILCDRPTFEAAKDVVEFMPLPPQQLKGRSEAVDAFHPLMRKRSVIRPTTEMIGRQEEKSVIANALQELSRGEAHQTLVVQGDAGIGKSRLFEDLKRQAETLRVKTFVSFGDSIERSTPYHVWRTLFYRIFNIEELVAKASSIDDARVVIQTQVINKLQEVDPDLVRYYPLLDVVLPIQIPENELTAAMTGEMRGSNIRELLSRLLMHEAQQTPLLIILEDLHWFDPSSWALLVDVQQKVRPLLLALNTRPMVDPVPTQFKEILEFEETKLLKLDAMELDDVESLVCQRLGVRSVPEEVGRLIREKSEGHPFFAEELAYALRDSGVLLIEDQVCRVNSRLSNFDEVTLPDTLQSAIINRIDTLNPSQQLTLKVASVIGRIFAFRVLEAIHPIPADKPQLPDYMESLTRLSLTLIETEPPDLAYIFKHAVTQEVAYNLMLFSQRRKLHQAVAEWLEQNHPDNLDSYYPLLAHHWTQAAEAPTAGQDGVPLNKALEYLERAGEKAMDSHASQEAIQFFSQALVWEARLPKPESRGEMRERNLRRARWHGRIGLSHYALGSLPDCDVHVREALRLLESSIPRSAFQFGAGLLPQVVRQALHRYFPARHIGSLKGAEREVALEVARLYELMSRIYFYSNETLPIMYTVLRFLNEAEKAGVSQELAIAYSSVAVLAGFAQLHPLAESYVKRALAVSANVDKPSSTITVNVVTSVYQMMVGKWDDVETRAREAQEICEQLGDYRQWGDAIVLRSESRLISGDIAGAEEIYVHFLQDARRRRNPLQQGWALFGLATTSLKSGREAQAIPMLEEANQILEALPNLASSINVNGQLALAHYRLGDVEKALSYAGSVLKLAENLRPTVYSLDVGFAAVANVYFDLWEAALHDPQTQNHVDEYRQLAERTIKILQSFKNVFPIGQPYLAYYQGWHAWLTGARAAAIKWWMKGLAAAEKFNLRYEEGLIRFKLGSFLDGDPAGRRMHLEKAAALFEQMGAVKELAAVQKIIKTNS